MNLLRSDLLRYMLYGALGGAAVTWLEMRDAPETEGVGLLATLAGGALGGAVLVLVAVAVRRYFAGTKR